MYHPKLFLGGNADSPDWGRCLMEFPANFQPKPWIFHSACCAIFSTWEVTFGKIEAVKKYPTKI